MLETTNQNQPKPTSEALEDIVGLLTTDQIRFVVARQYAASDKDAARTIGISPATVKDWKAKGVPIDEAVRLMAHDGLIVARSLRRRNLAKAMAVKVAGLDSASEGVRQSTATEIIEGELGKAAQVNKNEQTGEVKITVYHVPRRYISEGGNQIHTAPAPDGVP